MLVKVRIYHARGSVTGADRHVRLRFCNHRQPNFQHPFVAHCTPAAAAAVVLGEQKPDECKRELQAALLRAIETADAELRLLKAGSTAQNKTA